MPDRMFWTWHCMTAHEILNNNNEMPFKKNVLMWVLCRLLKWLPSRVLMRNNKEISVPSAAISLLLLVSCSLLSLLSVISSLSLKRWTGGSLSFSAHYYFLSLCSALLVSAFIPFIRHRHIWDRAVLCGLRGSVRSVHLCGFKCLCLRAPSLGALPF